MNVTLTQIPLNKLGRSGIDHTEAHRTVMGLFPPLNDTPRADANILFRIDRKHGRALIQATMPPSQEQVSDLGGETKAMDLSWIRDVDQVRYHVHFAALARTRSGERRLRVDEIDPKWAERAARCGLDVDWHDFDIEDRSSRGATPKLRVARITGTGTVTDADKLIDAVVAGVGRVKAYGCGLLSVAPL